MTTQNAQKARQTEQLTDAFRLFNELSQNLSVSYQGLEEQIAKLHRELAFAQSERLKTLEEKEKLANRLEKILAALPAGVIVLDGDGRVVDCNAVALRFLGVPLLGMAWMEIMVRSLAPVSDNPHEHELAGGERVTMTCSPLEDNGGQIILLSDVSEMRNLQDMLSQQKQLSAMGEMVASMAHQVRTPLATAILYASQMANPTVDHGKRQRYSEKILERLLHLERQVNDMLIFARDGRLAMERFSLSKLLIRLQEGFYDYAGRKAVALQITNTVTHDDLVGNENALRGALLNILNNAVDAVGEKGHVQLSVNSWRGAVRITISDNGPGIAEALQQRVLEPFFTTKPNGTGLGLAVVDTVVRAHSGRLTVESSVGQGTVFSITLPGKNQTMTPLPGGFSGKNLDPKERLYDAV